MNPLKRLVDKTYQDRLKTTLGDSARLEAVYGSRFWNEPDSEKLRAFCVTAAHTLKSSISQVNLITADGQHAIASYGLEEGTTLELDFSVCQHTVGVGETLNAGNMEEVPILCDLKAVTEDGIIAYLGVPLIDRNGYILGAFCVADYTPRDWTDLDVLMMSHLSSAIMNMHETGRFA